jgi:hypothetical protein
VEECDKVDITREHFDSLESSITSDDDRILAISNPPEDEHNVAAELAEDPRWHTIEFSSFDSHNVQVDSGELDAEPIPGLVDLSTIREDWAAWNQEPWPGLETARVAHLNRDDLDARWYRRRAGVIPPQGSAAHRPFSIGDVSSAWERGRKRGPYLFWRGRGGLERVGGVVGLWGGGLLGCFGGVAFPLEKWGGVESPDAVGIDVARGGDRTVMVGV